MAKTAAQRRTARKRKEQSRSQRPSAGRPPWEGFDAAGHELRELFGVASTYAADMNADQDVLARFADRLASLDPDVDRHGYATTLLGNLLRALWEHGWQPLDVAHVVRRLGDQRLSRLAVAAIATQAQVSGAASRAPEEWTAQLDALDALAAGDALVLSRWGRAEKLDAADIWRDALRLIGLLGSLGGLQQLSPPPSQWPERNDRRRRPAAHSGDARMLSRIRALLAKAESTDFPEEAEALTAKAQDLMSRHAIDAAVLDAEHGTSVADQVSARRVHIDNPYPEAKVQLLNAVAAANGVRTIWLQELGIVTAVGLPVDLDSVDLLFTSLLVQATRAMSDTGRAGTRQTRSPSFRRAFLLAYALRIGERLIEVRDQVTREASVGHAELVPVLNQRAHAVDDVFGQLFPEMFTVESRAVNARGWHAGRLAAENADLGSGRDQVSR